MVSEISGRPARPLARIADALGLAAHVQTQTYAASDDPGSRPSILLTIADADGDHAEVTEDPRWIVVSGDGGRVWTDDRANPLSALKSKTRRWFWELSGG